MFDGCLYSFASGENFGENIFWSIVEKPQTSQKLFENQQKFNATRISSVTQPPFDRHTTAARQGTYVPVLECLVTGPHIRTVPSSLDEAIIVGSLGFQLTQFTVLVCPLSTATGFSRFECQMYTLLSERHSFKLLDVYVYKLMTKCEVYIHHLLTESEVITGKSQTEALMY